MVEINGTCVAELAEVRRAFEANFVEHGEVGASVCVTVDGERVVDLWAGRTAGEEDAPPWQADTLVGVYSCTKGMTALCAHVLVARGLLDVDERVTRFWPEYARGDEAKAATTVRMLLDHSAGVAAWREELPDGSTADWDYMVGRVEAEAPFWEPGTRHGYHMLSFGWTVGELVRRVSGKPLGRFLAEDVAGPTGADVWIGLPEAEERRVARFVPHRPDPEAPSAFTRAIRADRRGLQALALLNQGRFNPGSRAGRASEVGGAGGLATARGLADLYRPLANGGAPLVDADTLARMGEVSSAGPRDATLLLGSRFSLGFMKSIDNRRAEGDHDSAILSSAAFGHVGAGGSIGFADPGCRMSFGYAMNRLGPGVLLNERGQGLVDAAYRALGYRSGVSGVWAR